MPLSRQRKSGDIKQQFRIIQHYFPLYTSLCLLPVFRLQLLNMAKNDKPTDTQAGQGSNKPSNPAATPTSAKKPAKDTNKESQNTRKPSSSNKNTTNIPERPKKKAPASGQNPPAKPQARSTKLGAFQPHRGVASTTVGGADEWQPYDPNSRQFIMVSTRIDSSLPSPLRQFDYLENGDYRTM